MSNMTEHLILPKNQTSNFLNITKNLTVCEHRTVRSTSSFFPKGTIQPQTIFAIPILPKEPLYGSSFLFFFLKAIDFEEGKCACLSYLMYILLPQKCFIYAEYE